MDPKHSSQIRSECLTPQNAGGGRQKLPEAWRDMKNWPGFDDSTLKGEEKRRYVRLRDATALYLRWQPVLEVATVAGVSRRRFLRIFERATSPDGNGQIVGFRAFVTRGFNKPPQRHKLNPPSADGRGGFSGAYRLLLQTHPPLVDKLISYLNGRGSNSLRPNRVLFRQIHRAFLSFCEQVGVQASEYPFNTQRKGNLALRKWIDAVYMPQYARRLTTLEHGRDAGDLLKYGEGDGNSNRSVAGYGVWIIDSTTVDIHARFELPSHAGDWDSLELRRFQHLRVIHKQSGANLAAMQVYSPQVSAADISLLLWNAMNGPKPPMAVIPNLRPEFDAGYPANAIPELRFANPVVIELDNALAHISNDVSHIVTHLFGARLDLGPPKTPRARAAIESKFSLLANRITHQLPGTTGTGPKDPMRKTHAVEVQKMLRAEELEQLFDVYVQNENALPAAAAGNISPLDRLRRLISAGLLRPTYLPIEKRKPHYFSMPRRVLVKVESASGRRPYINYMYGRYSSQALGNRFDLKGRAMYVRADFQNLRTVILFEQNGAEFGPLQALGYWGTFPYDLRMRKIFGKLKRDGELGPRADDQPLEAMFNHLRKKAPKDTNSALKLKYITDYLTRNDFVLSAQLSESVLDWAEAKEFSESLAILPAQPIPANPLVLSDERLVEHTQAMGMAKREDEKALHSKDRVWALQPRPLRT